MSQLNTLAIQNRKRLLRNRYKKLQHFIQHNSLSEKCHKTSSLHYVFDAEKEYILDFVLAFAVCPLRALKALFSAKIELQLCANFSRKPVGRFDSNFQIFVFEVCVT